jgi:hypothetical protein
LKAALISARWVSVLGVNALPHRAHVAERGLSSRERPAIHDFGVAVEIPLEQRTDIAASVCDKSVDGRHRMHHHSAHALMMPARPPDALRCAPSRRGRSVRSATPTQVGY